MNDAVNEPTKARPIRRVLRHRDSQQYFTGSGWTRNLSEARTFTDCLDAARTCAHCGLSQVELVLRVSGGTADLYSTEIR